MHRRGISFTRPVVGGTISSDQHKSSFLRITLLIVVLSLCISQSLRAQDSLEVQGSSGEFPDSVFSVDTVFITGNTHTRDFVISREMSLQPGVPITRDLLEYDKNRIYSLGLFNQVILQIVPTNPGKANVVVNVHERWFIFPYPIFGFKDRDWSKFFYGAGLAHINFRGRDEKLFTTFIFGYDPLISLTYRNPFLSEEGTYFLEGHLSYSTEQNKSVLAEFDSTNYDQHHVIASLSIGRRIGIQHTLRIGMEYDILEVSQYLPGRTLSTDGRDAFPTFQAGYTFDSRDLVEYPGLGSFAQFTITKFGFPRGTIDYVRYSADLRHYTPLGDGFVWTARTFTDVVAGGPTPAYDHVYFGYGDRIRGHFDEVFEGESIFGISSELHWTLLPTRYITVDWLPREFGLWKFGVVAAAFGDAGTVWFRGTQPSVGNFVRGYGVGLHFLLPYSWVLRTEYAWNEARRGEFIFDAGATF